MTHSSSADDSFLSVANGFRALALVSFASIAGMVARRLLEGEVILNGWKVVIGTSGSRLRVMYVPAADR